MVYQRLIKGLLDRISALILILILSPVIILVSGLIWINTRKSPFFTQPRPGLYGRVFNLYKLKTMTDARDEKGELLPDIQRITPLGKWMRKYSLDELPQLWNVLKGEMSLVGPRPLLIQYLPLYNDYQQRRHQVKPGITGLAQVKGRNQISWKEKFDYDIYYVEHFSLGLDLKILLLTIKGVLMKKGIDASDGLTSTYFTGNNE